MTPIARERVDRWPSVPRWAIVIVVGWLLLVGLSTALDRAGAGRGSPCIFRSVTGQPCPTCGSTRVVLAAMSGDVFGAIGQNPLVAIGGMAAIIWLLARVIAGRRLRLPISRRSWWTLGVVAFVLNWGYVIWRHAV